MDTFDAYLRLPGEEGPGLNVAVDLSDDAIALRAGTGDLGRWSRSEVRINALPDGFHFRAEGEEVILDITEDAEFAIACGLMNAPPLLRRKMAFILRERESPEAPGAGAGHARNSAGSARFSSTIAMKRRPSAPSITR